MATMNQNVNGHLRQRGTPTTQDGTLSANSEKDESLIRNNPQAQSSLAGIASAAAHAAVPNWVNVVLVASLIFGGCCANVFALEAIIKDQPSSGPLVTFAQFILTASFTLPSFFSLSAGPRSLFLNRRAIPLRSWVIYTAFFLTVNMLNNWAFAYKISVPLHIIVRSGGPVASMVVGYLFNSKRYSRLQILAVVMLTLGVVGAALADAEAQGGSRELGLDSEEDDESSSSTNSLVGSSSLTSSIIGFSILALAMILSAFQGIYADRLYETHGRGHWREALFYSHTLSLPFFLPTIPHLASQFSLLTSSPPLLAKLSAIGVSPECSGPLLTNDSSLVSTAIAVAATPRSTTSSPHHALFPATASLLASLHKHDFVQTVLGRIPVKVAYLALNAVTQYLCIRGVHLLSAKSSSLTVTIVLNIRKLVSLLLSIYIFGNDLATGILVGAALVFVGGGLYGFEGARLRQRRTSVKKD